MYINPYVADVSQKADLYFCKIVFFGPDKDVFGAQKALT